MLKNVSHVIIKVKLFEMKLLVAVNGLNGRDIYC